MNKSLIVGLTVVLAVCLVAAGAFAFGFGGQPGGHPSNQTKAAIEAGDYNAFVASLNGTTNITQTQFNALVTRYQKGTAMRTEMQAVQQAIANNDYAAWQTAMTTINPNADVSQTQFNALVKIAQDEQQVQQAGKNNDFTAWKTAMSTLAQDRANDLTQADFNQYVKAQQAGGTQHSGMYAGFANGPGRRGHGNWMQGMTPPPQ